MTENNFVPYSFVSVEDAMLLAGYGVYHECDADLMVASVKDYDLNEALAYAKRRG